MCGIFGVYLADNQVDRIKFHNSLCLMKHRGPNAQISKTYSNDHVGLGHARLSIIDLSDSANQPMEYGPYALVFNGEIYNYIELRSELKKFGYSFFTNSDSEVLLKAYIHWGQDCVSKFNGMWAFVIYDKEKDLFFGSRDRFGVKPFYYFKDSKDFIFASEIKSILNYRNSLKYVNYNSVSLFLHDGKNGELKDTWFENIYRLDPGHSFTLSNNSMRIIKYYSYPSDIDNSITFNDACSEFYTLFVDSVKLRMRSDVPVGTTLSGGLDSNSIVSAIRTFYSGEHHTFTAGFSDYILDESANADISNKLLDLKGHFVDATYKRDYMETLSNIIYHLESPHLSPAVFPLWRVYEESQKYVKVMLEGQGADELLGGYIESTAGIFLYDLLLRGEIKSLITNFKQISANQSMLSVGKMFIRNNFPEYFEKMLKNKYLKYNSIVIGKLKGAQKNFNPVVNSTSRFKEFLQASHRSTLVNLLHYGDGISMAFGMESRLPYMDYRLVNYCMKLPSEYFIAFGAGKYLQREALKTLIPEHILKSKMKLGFPSPLNEFVLNNKQGLKEILCDPVTKNRGIFDIKQIEELLKLNDTQLSKKNRFIYRLLSTELWFRKFIDRV